MKDRAQWLAVARFFDRPWFRRVWVQQEVAVAKGLFVLCGKQRLNWDSLSVAATWVSSPEIVGLWDYLARMVSRRPSGTGQIGSMDILREDWVKDRTVNAEYLFYRGRGADATDPRDRIYGLLSLSDIADKLKVDYAISPQEVFKRAMITLLNHQQSLNPLSGCQWRGGTRDLPSWVIDFNEDFETPLLRTKEGTQFFYRASGDESASYDLFESNNLLRARGFIVDTVYLVGPSFDSYDTDGLTQRVADYLQVAQQTVALRSSGVVDEEFIEEFCRTLTADQDD